MAKKNSVEIELNLDDRDTARTLKKLAKETSELEDGFEDAESSGKALARAIEQSSDDMIREIDATADAVKAMERQLDGTDFDSREVVADLKRLGLTAEDVEADAEQLATALRRAGDVKTHAAARGFDDVGQAVGSVRDETDRTKDTMTGFIGGTVGELPLISDAMGPVAEGLGQLAEGAIEGEIGFKQLGQAAGGMAIVAGVMFAINGYMESMAKLDALKAERVEDYADALQDADDELEAILDKLADVDKLSIDGSIMDLIPILNEAGVSADDFASIIAGGESSIDAWGESLVAAGESQNKANAFMRLATQELTALEEAQRNAAASAEFLAPTQDRVNDTYAEFVKHSDPIAHMVDTFDTMADTMSGGVAPAVADVEAVMSELGLTEAEVIELAADHAEALAETGEAASDTADDISDLDEAFSDLKDQMSDRSSYLKAQDGFDRVKQAADKAFDAADTGADDAAAAMRNAERATIDLKNDVIDYAEEVGNIPPEAVSRIIAAIDRGHLAEAQRLMGNLERTRTAEVDARADTGKAEGDLTWLARDRTAVIRTRTQNGGNASINQAYARGTTSAEPGAALVGEEGPELVTMNGGEKVFTADQTKRMLAPTSSRGGTTVVNNVTQNFPAGTRPNDVARASRRYARIQGPT